MITIFTIPKEFKGEYDRIQQNAIVSWLAIRPKPEIYLFGSEYGIDDVARKHNIHHISETKRSSSGVPLINDVFEKAQNLSMYDTVCFINADIILPPNFFDVINIVQKRFNNFLLVGKRWDCTVDLSLNAVENFDFEKIKTIALQNGEMHSSTGIDYFVFKKGLFKNLPPFAVGRTAYDEWLLYFAKDVQKVPLIDVTEAIFAIHQKHPYKHPQGADGIWNSKEAKRNLKLAGGYGYCYTIEDANYMMDKDYNVCKTRFRFHNFFKVGKRYIQRFRDSIFSSLKL